MMAGGGLRVSPFPAGKSFAVTFVDDTDLSTCENTRPVYDLLHEFGIRGTKTVWVQRARRRSSFRAEAEQSAAPGDLSGQTLEDDDYREFVLGLERRGYEIGLHGVAAGNSYRDEIIRGLDTFREIFGRYPRVNVFHARNAENLYGGRHKLDLWPLRWLERLTDGSDYQGHVPGSRYFWGDVARERITYMRLPFHTIRQVNTLRWNPSMPFHDIRRPYVNYWFASSDGADCERFNRLLSPANIERLARERGACVVYTHFAKGFARARADGMRRLDSGFVERMRHLSARPGGWFPAASELLDRLRACRSVRVEQRGYDVTIRHLGNEAVTDLALAAPPGQLLTDPAGDRLEPAADGCIALGTLGPGEIRRYTSNRRLASSESAPSAASIRWERVRLEMLNYLGLLGG